MTQQGGVELDQEQFCCSVCLDLLKNPVTIPCGHSYCMDCITSCWDLAEQGEYGLYSCPQCRDSFYPKPVLKKSNMLADVVESLKKSGGGKAGPSPDHSYAGPGDVACDSCTGRKRKSVKACLQCLVSYCDAHLQPHYQSPAFKKHKLVNASSGKLQENVCSRHGEARKLFCRTDRLCICYLCSVEEHKGHDTISAAAERTERQRELHASQHDIQQRIQDREKDVKVLKLIRDQLNKDVSWAEEQQRQRVEQEVSELRRRHAEMEQLSRTEDDIQFLQSYSSLSRISESARPVRSGVRPHVTYFEDVTVAVSKIRGKVEDILNGEESNSEPKTRDEFLRYLCPVTLDPNTAHTDLSLSKGNRKVSSYPTFQYAFRSYPYHDERFTQWNQVLCREGLSGRRFYWEVEWSGFGVSIAVAYKDISRRGLNESLFGGNDKSWIIQCCNSNFAFRHGNVTTQIAGRVSSRVGVYLDHSAGTLSFYKVGDTMSLLHRVQTAFTRPLYAGVGLSSFNGSSVEFCDLK